LGEDLARIGFFRSHLRKGKFHHRLNFVPGGFFCFLQGGPPPVINGIISPYLWELFHPISNCIRGPPGGGSFHSKILQVIWKEMDVSLGGSFTPILMFGMTGCPGYPLYNSGFLHLLEIHRYTAPLDDTPYMCQGHQLNSFKKGDKLIAPLILESF